MQVYSFSEISENMYDDGYHNIINVDISSVVISQMSKRNAKRDLMVYKQMDVRDLKYENGTFDLEIDKSTIDALLCGDHAFYNVAIMMKEIQRTLKVGGTYLAISYGKPENRISHFVREFLSFEVCQFEISAPEDGKADDDEDRVWG